MFHSWREMTYRGTRKKSKNLLLPPARKKPINLQQHLFHMEISSSSSKGNTGQSRSSWNNSSSSSSIEHIHRVKETESEPNKKCAHLKRALKQKQHRAKRPAKQERKAHNETINYRQKGKGKPQAQAQSRQNPSAAASNFERQTDISVFPCIRFAGVFRRFGLREKVSTLLKLANLYCTLTQVSFPWAATQLSIAAD